MSRDITLYVSDILENMNKAAEFTSGMDYGGFATDSKTAYAVVRCFEIIGEAAKNVPQDLRDRYSAIPWRSMAAMRDKMIHVYFGIDYEVVWLAVQKKLPQLRPQIQSLLEELRMKDST